MGAVQPRRLLLLLLLIPGLVFGPGWSLRFCTEQLLGTAGCCDAEAAWSCCPNGDLSPSEVASEIGGRCDACCIRIETPDEQYARGQDQLAGQLERLQVAALAVCVHAVERLVLPSTADPSFSPLRCPPPASPGQTTSLPLRI